MLPVQLRNVLERIEAIELWRFDVNTPRHFSFGTWHNRQHVFVSITAGGFRGWGEGLAGKNNPQLDVAAWGACFTELRGLSVSEALSLLRSRRAMGSAWTVAHLEVAEMALLDLAGRLSGQTTLDLLELSARQPVPGLYCILEEDPNQARNQAAFAVSSGTSSHVKLKIFGNNALDVELIRAVRQVVGPQAFLVADANCGYKCDAEQSLEALAADLLKLRRASLDACEDPARMSNAQWIDLQNQVGDLALLPDYPARTAWAATETLLPGMGRIYNLHPSLMGSLIDTVTLARKIGQWGAQLMVGDDSLIGPACTAWQQMAIGLGAVWMEALEKPHESDAFLECVTRQATSQQADGRWGMCEISTGFGLEVDVAALSRRCAQHVMV